MRDTNNKWDSYKLSYNHKCFQYVLKHGGDNYYLKSIDNKKIILPKLINQKQHVWHLFVIRTKKRDELQKYLLDNGIQTLIHYPIPPHHQLAYKEFSLTKLTITEEIHKTVLSLPISPILSNEETLKVINVLNSY